MKKHYETPEMELLILSGDVLTTSDMTVTSTRSLNQWDSDNESGWNQNQQG